ncbi:MAG: SCP2 sterol-binding domain-containing protein [Deltaproteobacteria bacterium]|nr:SCP2 sterol-binding domain-containing protein [Deltaproteobacteria bacterium]
MLRPAALDRTTTTAALSTARLPFVAPSRKDVIRWIFGNMPLLFDGDKYRRFKATYQFVFTDVDDGFAIYAEFDAGAVQVKEGQHPNPSVVVHTSSSSWFDVSGHVQNPIWAIVTRQLRVHGKVPLLGKLEQVLCKRIQP